MMQLDDEVCLCFHVTKRKVIQYIRVKRPELPSQLSECFGAGTGCGWCRPYLERILQAERGEAKSATEEELPDASLYEQSRAIYREQRKSVGDEA
jgi:bacterioferritin-associated ferredoxin